MRVLFKTLLPALLLLAGLSSLRTAKAAPDRARALVERTIANQHRDDRAIYKYQRVQRRVTYKGHAIISDKIYRMVPTGTGRLSLLLARGGRPVSLATYQMELRNWESVLLHAINPNDPREQHSEQLRRQRDRKRARLINAIGKAFHFTWLGEKVVDGRRLAHIALDPNPSYHPTSHQTAMLLHARATVWIDVRAAQLVSGKAEVISNISVGGGLISQIDPGGWFEIEQRKVAPGIWLSRRTEFSIHGRMLLFPFAEHKLTETNRYRYVGTPRQALELVRSEIKSGEMFPGYR